MSLTMSNIGHRQTKFKKDHKFLEKIKNFLMFVKTCILYMSKLKILSIFANNYTVLNPTVIKITTEFKVGQLY